MPQPPASRTMTRLYLRIHHDYDRPDNRPARPGLRPGETPPPRRSAHHRVERCFGRLLHAARRSQEKSRRASAGTGGTCPGCACDRRLGSAAGTRAGSGAGRSQTTAANNARTALGLPANPQEWNLEQRAAYNKTIAATILKYPNSFSAEQRNIAATMNTDYGLRGHHFDSALDLGLSAATGAKDYVQKLGMAIAIGAVFYLAFLAAIHRPSR